MPGGARLPDPGAQAAHAVARALPPARVHRRRCAHPRDGTGARRRRGPRPVRVRPRHAARRPARHGAGHDPGRRDGARPAAGRRRPRLRDRAGRAPAAQEPEAHHRARALRHLRADLRVRHPARDLRAAARDRGGLAQRGNPAGAPALDQRDRRAARPDRVADLGGDGGPGRRGRRARGRAPADPGGHDPRDAARRRGWDVLGRVPGRRARRRSGVPAPAPERRAAAAQAGRRPAARRAAASARLLPGLPGRDRSRGGDRDRPGAASRLRGDPRRRHDAGTDRHGAGHHGRDARGGGRARHRVPRGSGEGPLRLDPEGRRLRDHLDPRRLLAGLVLLRGQRGRDRERHLRADPRPPVGLRGRTLHAVDPALLASRHDRDARAGGGRAGIARVDPDRSSFPP